MNPQKQTVVSGIRATGNLHIGNYFGAINNFLAMQDLHHCFFFIADYHALTTHPDAKLLNQNSRQVLVEYLACGLDPNRSTIYLQSDLPETTELYLLLNMLAMVGELERCTSFKEKIRKHPDNVNAGLLTYPVLMAADILIHKATLIPVGKDQQQHLEMARDFVVRFNNRYDTDLFPQPQAYNFGQQLIKVPGLDGMGKMGKSEAAGNALLLTDDEPTIRKKIMKATTDNAPTEPNQRMSVPIENLFQLMNLVSKPETSQHFLSQFQNCTIRYGDMKKQLADDMVAFIKPINQNILSLQNDTQYIQKIAKMGQEKAKASAQKTLESVRHLMGFWGL